MFSTWTNNYLYCSHKTFTKYQTVCIMFILRYTHKNIWFHNNYSTYNFDSKTIFCDIKVLFVGNHKGNQVKTVTLLARKWSDNTCYFRWQIYDFRKICNVNKSQNNRKSFWSLWNSVWENHWGVVATSR